MTANPLTVLRLALPGQPSLRYLAGKVGCSHTQLMHFEKGDSDLSPQQVERYAKAVNSSIAEVRRRYWMIALERCEDRKREIQDQLRKLGVKDPRVRRTVKSA